MLQIHTQQSVEWSCIVQDIKTLLQAHSVPLDISLLYTQAICSNENMLACLRAHPAAQDTTIPRCAGLQKELMVSNNCGHSGKASSHIQRVISTRPPWGKVFVRGKGSALPPPAASPMQGCYSAGQNLTLRLHQLISTQYN